MCLVPRRARVPVLSQYTMDNFSRNGLTRSSCADNERTLFCVCIVYRLRLNLFYSEMYKCTLVKTKVCIVHLKIFFSFHESRQIRFNFQRVSDLVYFSFNYINNNVLLLIIIAKLDIFEIVTFVMIFFLQFFIKICIPIVYKNIKRI